MSHKTLEAALEAVAGAAAGGLSSTVELTKSLKQARAAAATGKLSEMERAIAQARQQIAIVAERISILESSWDFDAQSYFESGSYSQELLQAIQNEDMKPTDRDGRILCFPSILRVLPNDQTLEIDRKKERRVRPSHVAAELKKHRNRKAGIKPDRLIEILHRSYEVLVAGQKGTSVVRVVDIYDMLTQLPHAREYSKPEFARDLVQLDMSDVRTTRSGKRIELRADTAARGTAVLSAATPDGDVRLYSGVEFK